MKWDIAIRTGLCLVFNLISYSFFGQQAIDSVSLQSLFLKAESQYKVHFAYDPALTNKKLAPLSLLQKDLPEFINSLNESSFIQFLKQDEKHYLVLMKTDLQSSQVSLTSQKKLIQVNQSGFVFDALSSESLIGVSVILMPDRILFSTDEKGRFEIKHQSLFQNHWLEIRYLGYYPQKIDWPPLNNVLEIGLNPQIEMLDLVTISSVKSEVSRGPNFDFSTAYLLTKIDFNTTSVFRDPLRSIQQLSGLNGANDLSSGLQVRGGNTEENLILLDDLTLYSVDHFFGVFSNINPFMLDSVEIYKSHFPSAFGGRANSLIKMKTPVFPKKLMIKAEIGLLNSNLYLQVPIWKDRVDFMFAGRTSTTNLGDSDAFANLLHTANSNALNISRDQKRFVPANPEFKFNDVYLRMNLRPLNGWTISTSYFRSFDKLITNYQNTSSYPNLRVVENFNDTASWINSGISISSKMQWSKNFHSTMAWSNSNLNDQQKILGVITTIRTDTPRTRTIQDLTLFNNLMNVYQFRFDHHLKLNKSSHQLGFEWNHYDSTVFRNVINRDVVFFLKLKNGDDFNLYYQGEFQFFNKIVFHPGLRIGGYERRSTLDVSPRMHLQYSWTKNFRTSIRWGKYYQYLRQVDFEDRFGRPFSIWMQSDERMFNTLISDQWELQNIFSIFQWQFNFELYFKKLNGIAEQVYGIPLTIQDPTVSQPPLPRTVIFNGTGQSYGIDLSIYRSYKYYQLDASWSWINSTVQFSQINQGNAYTQALVRPHQFKLSQTFKYRNWSLHIYGIYGSPQPYVDLLLVGDRERNVRSIKEVQQILPEYVRIDLDLSYKYRMNKSCITAGIGILNLEDRNNVKYIQYVFRVPVQVSNRPNQTQIAGSEVTLLRRTLNLYINYEF